MSHADFHARSIIVVQFKNNIKLNLISHQMSQSNGINDSHLPVLPHPEWYQTKTFSSISIKLTVIASFCTG